MSEQKLLKARTPENPYGVDIRVETSGATHEVFCQFCEGTFWGDTLAKARGKYLVHQVKKHSQVKVATIHSFNADENEFLALKEALQFT